MKALLVAGCVLVFAMAARHVLPLRELAASERVLAPTRRSTPTPTPTPTPAAPVHPAQPDKQKPGDAPSHLRYLAIGGGATPESTEVSLEQDLRFAEQVLPGPGRLLFAGGADAMSVRTLDPTIDEGSLLSRLGSLFSPRNGRTSRYRKTALNAGPATLDRLERELGRALADGKDPLLVYIAAHGEQGDVARNNHVVLWGGEALGIQRLAKLQAGHRRPLRLVIASCFSGGFAELAFEDADPKQGITQAPRCGLFAGTWDRETSGCDPNPDQRAQESYSLHMLHALRREDRDGKPLAKGEVDFDGDGKVTLLEAHTRARIASTSIDVPTTTSERYLREVQKSKSKPEASLLPEDAAVVAQLGARLGLLTQDAVEQRFRSLERTLDQVDAELALAEEALNHAHALVSGLLLGRFPVLDDPYHPDFATTIATNAAAIQQLLDASVEAKAYASAQEHVDDLDERFAVLQVQDSVVLRLTRAYETLQLAAALKAQGGANLQHYKQLLACERGMP